MTMGRYIKQLRINKGWSQEELGKLVGVNRAAVNKWESGVVENIKRSTIKKLSQIFGVSPCELMRWDEEFQPPRGKSKIKEYRLFDKCHRGDCVKEFTTADRLKQIMSEGGMNQVDIWEACKPYCKEYGVQLKKNDLSQYVSGEVEPKQDKLSILGMALNVNEFWLMGYNVPAGRDELDKLAQLLQNKVSACEMFEQCHGKETSQAVKLFLQLDTIDKGRIIGSMETMLEDEKYSIQKRIVRRAGNVIFVNFSTR